VLVIASPTSSSSMALMVVGVVIVTANRFLAALTSTNVMVSSTPMFWSGCLRIGQADTKRICYSFFPLITDLIAANALLGKFANFGLPTEAGSEGTDGFTSVLHHSA
jgi:glycerol uptake facilitator-like aquaporin